MGQVVSLQAHRERRHPGAVRRRAAGPLPPISGTVEFLFDLRSPWTYLAAERVDRCFARVVWTPALLPGSAAPGAEDRGQVTARAHALRMPLVWPDRDGAGLPAMRVAMVAAERGRAAAFVLAAGRLAYCGGFDLDDPEILTEAAAAACVPLGDCLAAMGDRGRDDALRQTGRELCAQGATHLPALRVEGRLVCGEERLAEASALLHAPVMVPLRPH